MCNLEKVIDLHSRIGERMVKHRRRKGCFFNTFKYPDYLLQIEGFESRNLGLFSV